MDSPVQRVKETNISLKDKYFKGGWECILVNLHIFCMIIYLSFSYIFLSYILFRDGLIEEILLMYASHPFIIIINIIIIVFLFLKVSDGYFDI